MNPWLNADILFGHYVGRLTLPRSAYEAQSDSNESILTAYHHSAASDAGGVAEGTAGTCFRDSFGQIVRKSSGLFREEER